MKYQIVHAQSLEELADLVNKRICCGYEPVGNIQVVQHGSLVEYIQVIISKQESPHGEQQ